jgi:two-component system, NarL family, response regulator LiaR
MQQPCKIVIVDDHDLTLFGTQKFLEQHSDEFEVVGVAGDGQQALQLLDTLATTNQFPDILITDINMPVINGVELTRRVREQWGKELKIMVATVHQDTAFLSVLFSLGVNAYIAKAAKNNEFLAALRRVRDGETVIEGVSHDYFEVETKLFKEEIKADPDKVRSIQLLGSREQTVLQYLLLGCDAAVIGEELNISSRTAQNYFSAIYTKLATNPKKMLIEADAWKKALKEVKEMSYS